VQEADTAAKLISSLGAAARAAKSSEEFLAALLKTLIGTLSARAGAVYLADQSSVIIPFRENSAGVSTASEFTSCNWFGISPQTAGSVQLPVNALLDADEGWSFFEANVPQIPTVPLRIFPIKVSNKLRGAVTIYGADPNLVSDAVMGEALTEACTMLDIVTDRFLQRDLVELNKLSLSTVSADPSHFMSTLLAEVRKRLGCEGISFFAKDPTEKIPTFWLVGTAPRSMPENPTYYSSEDPTFTSRVLEIRTFCLVHYDQIRREDVVGLGAPAWRDVPADRETSSVIFAPVVKSDRPVALLRCTNRCSPDPTTYFNSIDLRRADAFAPLLLTWHIAAEKEHRFASSLIEISHEIKTGAAGVKSAANFVKRELSKRISLNTAEDLAQKLDHIARAADSFIKVLPALRRASGATAPSAEALRGFRPYGDLCKTICELFRGEATARHLTFRFGGQDQLGLIYAELEDFRPVFQNLISNAVKYTLPNKEIFVKLQRAEGEYAAIHVLSESLPVRPDEREAIFRFRYRAISARTSGTEGQGMGLAIGRAKARQLNGDLTFRTVDRLNIFSFLIPVKLFRPPQERPKPNANSGA
jgi:signal transduction histidine kinase